ncbi:MAG: winged helix-turn-helix transcriptional regulator [Geodermatophilaceae bacterium]|nr:winged helix-turn-helix transcriptional regulator [Geodermatophilaceae bacterium]
MLAALARESPLDQRTLGGTLAVDRSTVADIAARLNERGLITRTRDRDDARRNLLALTEQGRRLHDETAPEMIEVGRRLLEPLSAADRQHLVRCLTIMVATHERRATYRDRPPARD